MIFKLENSEVVINGKSVFKALIAVYVVKKICKAICKPVKHYYEITYVEVINADNQKISNKKQKVESK